MRYRIEILLVSFLVLTFGASNAFAAYTPCAGKVLSIGVRSSGVFGSFENCGTNVYVCRLSDGKNIESGAEGCKAAISLLLAAKLSDKNVRIYLSACDYSASPWQYIGGNDICPITQLTIE